MDGRGLTRLRAAVGRRLREPEPDHPRDRLAAVVERDFASLDPAVVDAYFDNFGWAMPLSLVQQLVGLVESRRPGLVVEVGSGASTIALSATLGDGFLVSVEQDADYAAATARRLGNAERVALVCATNAAELATLAAGWRPDLVVIDGPSGDRFLEPWLRFYGSLLSADCPCAVDDTDRAENDRAATALAEENGLVKHDFGDPLQPRHRYSLLLPAGVAPPPSAAVAAD